MDEATRELVTEKLKTDHASKILPDVEIKRFLHMASNAGLDPLANQIHLIPRWDDRARGHRWTVQTGIDGFRLVAGRTGAQGGNDEAKVEGLVEGKYPEKITFTVYRIVQGIRCPFPATARWLEYYPGEKQGFMWRNKPHIMLEKCAEALSLRRAFPAELSGLYIKEEMEQGESESKSVDEVTVEARSHQQEIDLTKDQIAERNRLQDCMYENAAKLENPKDEEWVRGWLKHKYPNSKGYAVGLSDEQFDACFAKLPSEQRLVVRPVVVEYGKEARDRLTDLLVRGATENDQEVAGLELALAEQFPGSGGKVDAMTDVQVHALLSGWGEGYVVYAQTGEWTKPDAEVDTGEDTGEDTPVDTGEDVTDGQ